MMDIKGALTRPLGPLPAWAWGVVIGGGYLLYRYLKNGSLFGSSTTAATTAAVVPASDYGSGATGSGGTTTSTTPTTTTTLDPTDPTTWVPSVTSAVNSVVPTTGTYLANTSAKPTLNDWATSVGLDPNAASTIIPYWQAQLPLFTGVSTPTASIANQIPNNAGSEANLTGPEYAATVLASVPGAPTVDFLQQTKNWQAANVGSSTYLDQLYNRLNLLANAYTSGQVTTGSTNLGPAITATQAEINRVEKTTSPTGSGGSARTLSSATLVSGEGVYTSGTPAIQALLTSAGTGINPTAAIDHTANVATPTMSIAGGTPLTLAEWEKNVASRSPGATTTAVDATALKDYNAQQLALKK